MRSSSTRRPAGISGPSGSIGDLSDIFAVQDEVTTHIVSALSLNLSASDRQSIDAGAQPTIQEAYDCFLRRRELCFLHYERRQPRSLDVAAARHITLPLLFSPPTPSSLAARVIDYANWWSASPSQALVEAYKRRATAVQLDERYPYALWALALICLWARLYYEALSYAEKVVAFNPNFADGTHFTLGFILHYVGRSEDALKSFERRLRARTLFPRHMAAFPRSSALPAGPISRGRRTFSSGASAQPRHRRLPRAARRQLRPDVPYRRGSRGMARITARQSHTIPSSSDAKCCLTITRRISSVSSKACARPDCLKSPSGR